MSAPNSSGWLLAVDFGTSNTAAAHINELSGVVQALPLSHGGNLIPSAVFVDSGGQIEVGEVAVNRSAADRSALVTSPKQLITSGQLNIHVGGWDAPAHSLVAGVLRAVLIRSQEHHGDQPPAGLVLTHPEEWSADRVRVLTEAAGLLGYSADRVRTVSEPRSAVQYYARAGQVQPGTRVDFFDFGGGTLDIAVLEAAVNGTFEVIGAGGDNALGGRDFDTAIRGWLETQLASRNPELLAFLRDGASARELGTVDRAVRSAKEILSEA
ncbi:MAG: Hsp70 family protein, partial [Mycobacteriaceae bacterium]|nr:Hsp70 family protein [Mycobacteriaceae bacterium]